MDILKIVLMILFAIDVGITAPLSPDVRFDALSSDIMPRM